MRSAVLAGGAARRFDARPKGLEKVGDHRILDTVVEALHAATGSLPVLLANTPDAAAWRSDLAVVPDQLSGTGTLIGIHTAVTAGDGPVLIAAWDMPFLHPDLLRTLCDRSVGFDVYLPESRGPRGCEPLCGVYGPACADPIARTVGDGDLRATAFHHDVKVGFLPIGEVERFGNPDEMFLNVNAPEELAAARALHRRRTGGHRPRQP